MSEKDLRFLVVDDEADEVGVAWRPEVLPGQCDGVTCCDIGHELKDVTFTCFKKKGTSCQFYWERGKPIGLSSGF